MSSISNLLREDEDKSRKNAYLATINKMLCIQSSQIFGNTPMSMTPIRAISMASVAKREA
jgi:hypothetical protein